MTAPAEMYRLQNALGSSNASNWKAEQKMLLDWTGYVDFGLGATGRWGIQVGMLAHTERVLTNPRHTDRTGRPAEVSQAVNMPMRSHDIGDDVS